MLHTIKQLQKAFNSLLHSNLNGGELNASLSSPEVAKDYLEQNKQDVINYINSLDLNNDSIINIRELLDRDDDQFALNKLFRTLDLDSSRLDSGVSIQEIVEVMDSYLGETNKVSQNQTYERSTIMDTTTGSSLENRISYLLSNDYWIKEYCLPMLKGANLSKSNRKTQNKGQVEFLQRLLDKLGYDITYGGKGVQDSIDSDYGNTVEIAVILLQGDLGLNQTGSFGEPEYNAIYNLFNPSRPNQRATAQRVQATPIQQPQQLQQTRETGRTEFNDSESTGEIITEEGYEFSFDSLVNGTGFGRAEKLRQVNYSSLLQIIESNGIDEVYNNVMKYLGEGKFIWFWQTGSKGKGLTDLGYQAKGGLDYKEIAAAAYLLADAKFTQERVSSYNEAQILNVLLDFDQDGALDTDADFYYGEQLSRFQINDSITSRGVDIFFTNIGLDKNQVFTLAKSNYLGARNMVLEKLRVFGQLGVNMSELTAENGAERAIDSMSDFNKFRQEIEAELLARPGDLVGVNINSREGRETVKALSYEGASLMLGEKEALGINFNVGGSMSRFIDSVSVGTYGVMVNKAVFAEQLNQYGVKLNVGTSQALIPIGSASYSYARENGITISPFISGTDGVLAAGVGFGGLDESSSQRIESRLTGLRDSLARVLNGETNLTAEEQALSQKSEAFMSLRPSSVDENDFKSIVLEAMMKAAEVNAYSLNQGTGVNDFSIGALFLGSNIVPLIAIGVESIDVDWTETLTNADRQLENTKRSLTLSELGVINIDGGVFIPQGRYRFEPLTGGDITYSEVDGGYNFYGNIGSIEARQDADNQGVYYKLTVTEGSGSSSETKIESIEGVSELAQSASRFERHFSEKTRWNAGAKEFLTPGNSIDVRWAGLVEMANRTGALRRNGVPEFLDKINSTQDKLFVLSTFIQYTKKAKDFANGSLEAYNDESSLNTMLSTEAERRDGFNTQFGFNTDEYYTRYVESLRSAGTVGETSFTGTAFDASSTLFVEGSDKGVKGVDALYANLQILTVDGNALMIPIDNQSHIDAFISKLESDVSMVEGAKDSIIAGLRSGEIVLYYYKDPDGFDDRIIPLKKGSDILLSASSTTTRNNPEIDIDTYTIGWTGKVDEDEDDNGGGGGDDQDTTPGVDEGGNGEGGSGGGNEGDTGNDGGGRRGPGG